MTANWLRRRWAFSLLALGSLLVFAAVACSGDETPTNTPTGAGPTATVAPTTAPGAPTATSAPGAPTATTPPSTGPGPEGRVTRAFTTLEAVYGIGYAGPYRTSATNQWGGVEENFFVFENGDPMTGELIDTWSIDPAGTKFSAKLHENIPFQAPRGFESTDFGIMDANEVVEWFNRSNANTNPDSTHGDAGDYAAIFLDAHVVDQFSFEVDLVTPVFFCLPISQFGCLSAARGPHKVTHVDQMGFEWARAHHVGTGPYVQGNCVAGDRCTLHAVDNHWRHTGNVAELVAIQVPEANTQISMLRNGQIDMAQVDYQLLPDIIDGNQFRFLETMAGGFVTMSILWSGNLWEHSHARTGEDLNPWASPAYAVDYPWLGNPWGTQNIACPTGPGYEKCGAAPYTENNNPDGMDDMEQARLVRLALGIAIDRDGINENLLGGIGLPLYSEYYGPEYPNWDPNRMTGCWDWLGNRIDCTGTMESVPWQLDDANLAEADRLLELAGFPRPGGTGLRQNWNETITLNAYAAEAGPVSIEVANAIMSDWTRLGLQVEGLLEDYGGVISPRMRLREQFNPVFKNGDVHSNVYPKDWPFPPVDTSSSRPGWGVGFESQAGAKWLFEMLAERDKSRREAMHMDWADFGGFWQQYGGVFMVPKGITVNDRIASWNGRQQHYSNVSGNPEFIVLR